MTSASMGCWASRLISTTAPTGAGSPATAAASPSVRMMLPVMAVGSMASSCVSKATMGELLVQQFLLDACQLLLKLLIERAKFRIDAAAAGCNRPVGDDLHFTQARQLAGDGLQLGGKARVVV